MHIQSVEGRLERGTLFFVLGNVLMTYPAHSTLGMCGCVCHSRALGEARFINPMDAVASRRYVGSPRRSALQGILDFGHRWDRAAGR